MSFAAELIENGDYEEAVTAATKVIDAGDATAETFLERATARELLEVYDGAVEDFETALARNAVEKIVDQSDVDDRYFSALVAAGTALRAGAGAGAGAGGAAAAVQTIDRYDRTFRGLPTTPRHAKEAAEWRARFRGELPSLLDKTVETNYER
jgi:hypothetical protein